MRRHGRRHVPRCRPVLPRGHAQCRVRGEALRDSEGDLFDLSRADRMVDGRAGGGIEGRTVPVGCVGRAERERTPRALPEVGMTEWRDKAECAGMADPTFATADPFHPKHDDKDSDYEYARTICGRCPVAAECLEDAMATETGTSRVGMRGALTPMQRAALGRKRGRGTGVSTGRG